MSQLQTLIHLQPMRSTTASIQQHSHNSAAILTQMYLKPVSEHHTAHCTPHTCRCVCMHIHQVVVCRQQQFGLTMPVAAGSIQRRSGHRAMHASPLMFVLHPCSRLSPLLLCHVFMLCIRGRIPFVSKRLGFETVRWSENCWVNLHSHLWLHEVSAVCPAQRFHSSSLLKPKSADMFYLQL